MSLTDCGRGSACSNLWRRGTYWVGEQRWYCRTDPVLEETKDYLGVHRADRSDDSSRASAELTPAFYRTCLAWCCSDHNSRTRNGWCCYNNNDYYKLINLVLKIKRQSDIFTWMYCIPDRKSWKLAELAKRDCRSSTESVVLDWI